jgi:transposase-like protein
MSKAAVAKNVRRSIEEKRAVVAQFHNRKAKGLSVEAIAEKHGITTATVYHWAKQDKEGQLHDPNNPSPRQNFPAEVRAKAVADYLKNPQNAELIAHALGIGLKKLHMWVQAAQQQADAALVSAGIEPENGHANGRKKSTALARVPAQHVRVSEPQQLSFEMHPAALAQELVRERKLTARLKNMLIRSYQEHANMMIAIVQEM